MAQFERSAKKNMSAHASDYYDEERKIIVRKFAVLRHAAGDQQSMIDWITRKENIALQCVEKHLPKKTIQSIHSEIRIWIRDGVFHTSAKDKILAEISSIDAERK